MQVSLTASKLITEGRRGPSKKNKRLQRHNALASTSHLSGPRAEEMSKDFVNSTRRGPAGLAVRKRTVCAQKEWKGACHWKERCTEPLNDPVVTLLITPPGDSTRNAKIGSYNVAMKAEAGIF